MVIRYTLLVVFLLFSSSAQSEDSQGAVSVLVSPRQVSASLVNPQPKRIVCAGKLYAKTDSGETQTAVLEKCATKNGEKTCSQVITLEPSGEFYLYLSIKGKDSTSFVKGWHDIMCGFE